tara:strand:- start:2618 stop:3073 length:456 start_codon:yes stop_codon:yes gene_type:complete
MSQLEPITLKSIKTKDRYKNKKTLLLLFVLVIVLGIMSAASLGRNVLSFCVFYLFFGMPLLIIYSDTIITLIPQNIASYFINEVEDIKKEITVGDVNIVPIYNIDYLVLFLGISTYIMSVFILFRQKDKFVGLIFSMFLCSVSNIIISDIF